MRVIQAAAIVLLSTAPLALVPADAQAKGCIKGAIVGGVAGHIVGHGKVGALAGCVIGHHNANKSDEAPRSQTDQDNRSR